MEVGAVDCEPDDLLHGVGLTEAQVFLPLHHDDNEGLACRIVVSHEGDCFVGIGAAEPDQRLAYAGNPAGRLRGSRNRLSEALTCALLRDFSKHGEKAIAKVRRTHPAAYLKICALLVSREMKVERSGGVKDMTDEQLEQAIATIQAMIDARSCRLPLFILSYPSGYPRAVVTWIREVQENP